MSRSAAIDGLAVAQAARDLPHRPLAHAEDEEVRLGVEEDRAAHGVGPVVVVRDAAQRRFDAAEDDGHVAVGFARAIGVDDGRAVGAHPARAARGVLILAAVLLLRGEAIEHRVHVAGGDAEEEARPTERAEGVDVAPVGLREDADLEAAPFEEARDQGRAERGVIDVGITRDDDDVELAPAASAHVVHGHRQERMLEAPATKLGQSRRHRAYEDSTTPAFCPPRAASCRRRRGNRRGGRGSCRCRRCGRRTNRC